MGKTPVSLYVGTQYIDSRQIWDTFQDTYLNVLDTYLPKKKGHVRVNTAPFKGILSSILAMGIPAIDPRVVGYFLDILCPTRVGNG